MRLRRLVAVATSVALLSLVIAAPASAGGPATYKVGMRGVEYGVATLATNCPEWPLAAVTGAGRPTPTRAGVDAALKTKIATRSESMLPADMVEACGPNQKVERGTDYYAVIAMTAALVFGQAGSGYEYTGLGAYAPATEIMWITWIWNGGSWDVYEGWDLLPAYDLVVVEDLAFGGASTWIPGLGWLDVGPCVASGAWYRTTDTITGGVDPGDGWTYDLTMRARLCDGAVWLGGTQLVNSTNELTRTVVTTVDVYPYPF